MFVYTVWGLSALWMQHCFTVGNFAVCYPDLVYLHCLSSVVLYCSTDKIT